MWYTDRTESDKKVLNSYEILKNVLCHIAITFIRKNKILYILSSSLSQNYTEKMLFYT